MVGSLNSENCSFGDAQMACLMAKRERDEKKKGEREREDAQLKCNLISFVACQKASMESK